MWQHMNIINKKLLSLGVGYPLSFQLFCTFQNMHHTKLEEKACGENQRQGEGTSPPRVP